MFVQNDGDGGTALLITSNAVRLLIRRAIFHQFGITMIACVGSNAPREDIQTIRRGSEAVIAAVVSISVVRFDSGKWYGGPRSVAS